MLIYAIDDEESALYYLQEALKEATPDAEILTFQESAKMLDEFRTRPADVVFLDVEMPGKNGVEIAAMLNEIKENINIIFVTGYAEYALDAMNVYASGYVLKPCDAEDIKKALEHLRFPLKKNENIRVRTFGNFDVFVGEKPIRFRSPKSQELLAYLVDRLGASVSRMEVAGILYEDDYSRTVQQELSRNSRRLLEDLENAGVKNLFFSHRGYYVDLSHVSCDLVDFLSGKNTDAYLGEYMEQYSWAEFRKGFLARRKKSFQTK